MSQPLHDKVAIVTGAGGGIGRAIAGALAGAGATVVLAARNAESLAAAADAIRAAGGRASTVPTDVTDEAQVIRLFESTIRDFGRVDLLVNNAGVSTDVPAHELSLAEWRRVLDVNLTGAFLCSREALKHMRPRRSGRIINIGSVAATVPRPNTAPYAVSKAGLHALSHELAIETRAYGVTVCIVHPGNTRSGFWAENPERADAEGVMAPESIAQMVLTIATMPADVLVFETVMLPRTMPYLGRG